MRTFKAIIEYDGTAFNGFQWQQGSRTVQGVFEEAIAKRTGQTVRLTGAGRTDTGVHALGQVVSFAAETGIPTERMAVALDSALPDDVSVRSVEEVDAAFSARFSASSRVYGYVILNRNTPSALLRRYTTFVSNPLDVTAMRRAASDLLGERDFAAFCNELQPDEPTFRDVMRLNVGRWGNFVIVRVEANAFLRGMVRCMVGTLLEVGTGRRAPDSLPDVLRSRERKKAGPSAQPQGLTLLRVRYGERKNYASLRDTQAATIQPAAFGERG